MKCILLTPWISPHQLPLAEEIVKLIGVENFLYFYLEPPPPSHVLWGWDKLGKEKWCKLGRINDKVLLDCELLLSGVRDVSLFEERAKRGKQTLYMSERWFKPPIGMFRLLEPSYGRMAERFVKLLDVGGVVYLPIGIHAARDMARLCGLMHGDWRCLFRPPELDFERMPGGRIWLKNEPRNTRSTRTYCLDKMQMWGYFVESSKFAVENSRTVIADDNSKSQTQNSKLRTLRVLWVGRLLKLKRVDTIIRAVGELYKNSRCNKFHSPTSTQNSNSPTVTLDIYGTGPEEVRLKRLAAKYGDAIRFYPPVHVDEVRNIMRNHDVYVLSSNAYEGWGAVVSEALEEGMEVIGTYEAGSSATMLPEKSLFHAGDWKCFLNILCTIQCSTKMPTLDFLWCAREAAKVVGC